MRAICAGVALLGLALIGWSAWLYHFAAVPETTDEPRTFWLGIGSLMLILGAVSLVSGVRCFRRRRKHVT
jgi:hypothetical protein